MDISQTNWNEVDDNNSTAAPDGAPEGMPPSGVNNTMRAMMGAIKRWYDQAIPKATDGTGTSTAFTLTYSVAPTALADGMVFLVKFDKTCGASPTLNVNTLGAKPIYAWYTASGAWAAVNSGDILAGQTLRLVYDQTSGNFRILTPLNVVQTNSSLTVPTGVSMAFRGSTSQVPAGWVLERGNSIGDGSSGATERANADTVNLFTLLWANTNYGLQNSSGTTVSRGANAAADYAAHCRLVLPDMTNKFRRGSATAAATGGSDSHAHSVSASGSNITGPPNDTAHPIAGGSSDSVPSGTHNHNFSVSVSGSSDTQNNIPAYVSELSIIKL
jgi:hypothetical protein